MYSTIKWRGGKPELKDGVRVADIVFSGLYRSWTNSPLMAGGGDSVAGVILLPFPQTGAGRRFKALVPVFQQAEGQTQTSSRTKRGNRKI